MRVLVGRLIPAIESHRGAELYSYPLGAHPPAWWTQRHSASIAARRVRGLTFLADTACIGLGTLDVTDYYRSVDPETAQRLLISMGCPTGAVDSLTAALVTLENLGGPGGLPIGFEGSGILGNAMLYPIDIAIREVVPFVRYTDDLWTFPRSDSEWDTVRGLAEATLAGLGLSLNDRKVNLWTKPWDDPEGIIRNRTLDSVTAAGTAGTVSADTALGLLEDEATAPPAVADWTVIRFALGVLGGAQDKRAVDVLEEHEHLFVEEPAVVGRYLSALAHQPSTAPRLDRDWLADRAASGGARELAARLHACVAASHLHLSKDIGKRFFEMATTQVDQRRGPFQVWAATAWGASEDWKPARSVDAAEHFGSLQLRRAFCLPFAVRGAGKKAMTWKTHLTLKEPDLRPTAEYVFN